MKKILLFALLCIIPLFIYSQKKSIKWNQISKEEINLKECPFEPQASAVVLYDIGYNYFDKYPNGGYVLYFYERHIRIKILKDEGIKYAQFKVTYQDMNCEKYPKELSYNIKAVQHDINNDGKLTTKKIKSRNIEHTDSTNCLKNAIIKFPDAKVGSIIEIKYIIPSFDVIRPKAWDFQKAIPVMNSVFRARVPFNMSYHFSIQNNKNNVEIDSVSYNKLIGGYYFSGTEYIFSNKNISSIINPYYISRINIFLNYFRTQTNEIRYNLITRPLTLTFHPDYERLTPTQRTLIRPPVGYSFHNVSNWEKLNFKLLKDEKFTLALIKNWNTNPILDSIFTDNQNNNEKIKVIYETVKKRMKWDGNFSLKVDITDQGYVEIFDWAGIKVTRKNLGDIWQKGTGSSSEINFILMHLLTKAGIKVKPVLTNTKNNYPVDRNIPDYKQFKTVIALVETESGKIFLDAADPGSNFESIADKYKGTDKFVVSEEDFGWIEF